jgi:hypothetical protein
LTNLSEIITKWTKKEDEKLIGLHKEFEDNLLKISKSTLNKNLL